MGYPLLSDDGKPLVSRGRKPMAGDAGPSCTCCDGDGPCENTPAEPNACLEALNCLHNSWFLVEGIFEDTAKAPWSIFNGIPFVVPPTCKHSLRDRLQKALLEQYARRLKQLDPAVIACCEAVSSSEYQFVIWPEFNCVDGVVGVRASYAQSSSSTDSNGDCFVIVHDFQPYVTLPASLPAGEVIVPIPGVCGFPEDSDCDCPTLVALKITQLTGCEGPCGNPDACPCPPKASFTLQETGNCQYKAVNASEPGCCGEDGLFYYWTDGVVGRDREDVPFIAKGQGCGDGKGTLGLVVVDKLGCYSYAERIAECCSCSDTEGAPCSTVAGTLTVELIDPANCVWKLTASVPGGQALTCGNVGVIEWRKSNGVCDPAKLCTCEQIAGGDCGGVECSGFLADGESTTVVMRGGSIKWRPREDACGCWGDWDETPTPCASCYCCEGTIESVFVTLENCVIQDEGALLWDECDCFAFDGTWDMSDEVNGVGECFFWFSSAFHGDSPEGCCRYTPPGGETTEQCFLMELGIRIACEESGIPDGNIKVEVSVNQSGTSNWEAFLPVGVGEGQPPDPPGDCAEALADAVLSRVDEGGFTNQWCAPSIVTVHVGMSV